MLALIKLGSSTEIQAQDLRRAYSPATSGRDVLDESYRKAGKLDVGSWLFSPASRSNLTVQLVSGLFHPIPSPKEFVSNCTNSMSIVKHSSFTMSH